MLLRALGYGAEVRGHESPATCMIVFKLTVPDMVPPFRERRIEISDYVLHTVPGVQEALLPARDWVQFVHREREVRAWAFCDL